jgi:hypothetical protein
MDKGEIIPSAPRGRVTRRRTEFLLRVYTLLGIAISASSALYIVAKRLGVELDQETTLALFTAFAGVILAVISQLLIAYLRERDRVHIEDLQERDRVVNMFEAWREFENLAMGALDYPPGDTKSPRDLIKGLVENKVIRPDTGTSLETALAVRNSIAHGGEALPPELLEKYLAEVARVSSLLKQYHVQVVMKRREVEDIQPG